MKDSILSSSSLKKFAKSPNHFIDYKENPQGDKPEFAFGRAIHSFVLEHEKFDDEYVVFPKFDKRTKEGKKGHAEAMEAAGDKAHITEADFGMIKLMDTAVKAMLPAVELLMDTQRETHVEGTIYGVPFHGYVDAHKEGAYAIDLKSSRDSSPDSFMRDAHNMDYHLQAAVYRHLCEVDRFYWIVVEKSAPFNVSVYMQSPDAMQKSDYHLKSLIDKWKAWDGKPKSYSDEIMTLDLPRWA